jgi:predicted nucleic acid-binding protein
MVPTPVISEYLVGAPATELHELEIIRRGFEYPALDLPSARLAAELQRGGVVDAIHDEFGAPKQSIRIDAFIIAIAIVNGASWIVTNNVKEFTALARGRIPIMEVPRTEEQLPLFPGLGE